MNMPKFKVGDWVRINSGVFAGRIALVDLVQLDWKSFAVVFRINGLRKRRTFAAEKLDLHAAGPDVEMD